MRYATDARWQTRGSLHWSRTGAFGLARLSRVGLLAALAAALANLAIFLLGKNLLGIAFVLPHPWPWSPAAPLSGVLVAAASVASGIGVAILVAALAWVVQRPIRTFQVVAAVVVLLSLGGPLSLPASVEPATKLALSVMHLAAAVVIVGVLTLGIRQPERPDGREHGSSIQPKWFEGGPSRPLVQAALPEGTRRKGQR